MSQISSITGRFVDVRAAEVQLRRLLEVAPELLELGAVEAELALSSALRLGQVAAAEQVRDRVLLDDAEEEEVEDDDEGSVASEPSTFR